MNIKIFQKNIPSEFWLALVLFFAGVSLRFLPHAPNFTPIGALALFGGAYFSKRTALLLPILAMLASDFLIGFYEVKIMLSVYLSFMLSAVLGFWLRKNQKWSRVLGLSVFSAILFFLITNFAVWAFSLWYPKTFAGLLQSYLMGLPFFKATLLGNLFFASCFFGAYKVIKILASRREASSLLRLRFLSNKKLDQ